MIFGIYCSLNAYADVTILPWTAEIDAGSVSGVARCGPNSGSTSTDQKNFIKDNWGTQNKGCFCRVQDINLVTDWNTYSSQVAANWYGSGTQAATAEECLSICADACKTKFEENTSYQNSLCGGTCEPTTPTTPQPQYTIAYNLNGGSGCETQTYTDSVNLCTPSFVNYVFDGWATSSDGDVEYYGGDSVSNTDLTLFAKWSPVMMTYYFYCDSQMEDYIIDDIYETPVVDGLTFPVDDAIRNAGCNHLNSDYVTGWTCFSEDGQSVVTFQETDYTEWTQNFYDFYCYPEYAELGNRSVYVFFDTSETDIGSPTNNNAVTQFLELDYGVPESEIPQIVTPYWKRYNFLGYYDTPNSVGGGTKYFDKNGNYLPGTWNRNSDITLYAHWNEKTFNLNQCTNPTEYSYVARFMTWHAYYDTNSEIESLDGIGICSSVNGENQYNTAPITNETITAERDNYDIQNTDRHYCWCYMSSPRHSGVYVYIDDLQSSNYCYWGDDYNGNNGCAMKCGEMAQGNSSFRAAMFEQEYNDDCPVECDTDLADLDDLGWTLGVDRKHCKVTIPAGYYADYNNFNNWTDCEEGFYCTGSTLSIAQFVEKLLNDDMVGIDICPDDTHSSRGATGIEQCCTEKYDWNEELQTCKKRAFECLSGKWWSIGNVVKDRMCLSPEKLSADGIPSLKFKIGDTIYYLGLTKDQNFHINNVSNKKMRLLMHDTTFNVFDGSLFY